MATLIRLFIFYCNSFTKCGILIKGGDFVLDYLGLERVLRDNKKDRTYLHEHLGISRSTIAKFKKGESVSVSILERICLEFDCQLSDLCQIKKDHL